MPIQTLSRSFDGPVPYFASSFPRDSDLACIAESTESDMISSHVPERRIPSGFSSPESSPPSSKEDPHYTHRTTASVSTLASENTECSPSVTISPTDSSTNSEITPGTSPDTPASMHSMSFLALRAPREVKGETFGAADSEFSRPAPPAKRARNLKNLAVNTSNAFAPSRKATTASFPIEVSPENNSPSITSPAFVKPLPTPKRRQSNLGLTLKTPGTGTFAIPHPFNIVPPTPNPVRPTALRHFQSSPALPTFASIQLPEGTLNSRRYPLRRKSPVSAEEPPSEQDETQSGQVQNFDESESRGASPNAYPEGPICIYEPNVYLYLEPSAEEASAFDVVFNVASEVKNPFQYAQSSNLPTLGRASTFAASTTFTIPESPKGDSTNLPVYHHIPWEHNTDIVPDLSHLVRQIDEYAQNGKKILIHCQCGVSRSASLVVAYGLYKNPIISVQQAYDAVKQKSQWIGPNMNLIMQLQEFRTVLLKKSRGSVSIEDTRSTLMTNEERILQPHNGPDGPRTAPSRPDGSFGEEGLPQAPTPVSPGPSSAPSGLHCLSNPDFTNEPRFLSDDKEKPSANPEDKATPTSVVPILNSAEHTPPVDSDLMQADKKQSLRPKVITPTPGGLQLPSNLTSAEFAMTTLMPTNNDDIFGLMSPRTTTFNTELPHRQLHGDTAPQIRAITHSDPERSISQAVDLDITPTASTSPSFRNHQPEPNYTAAPMNTTSRAEMDFSSVLMSPRAFEFTQNPFHDLLTDSSPSLKIDPAPIQPTSELDILMSPRALEFTQSPFSNFLASSSSSPHIGPSPIQATPEADTLMSPRAVEFTISPFNDALDSQPPVPLQQGTESADEAVDPRSPPQKIGSPIFRNIFEVL